MTPSTRIPASAFAVAALIALLPAAAWASGVTPMMRAVTVYLYVVTIGLAFLEAGLLLLLFKFHIGRALLVMVPANIASAFVASQSTSLVSAVFAVWTPSSPIIEIAVPYATWVVATAIVATVVVEWPFLMLAAPKGKRSLRAAALRCAVVHAISIPVSLGFFLDRTNMTLATRTTLHADASAFAKPPIGTVLFIRGNALYSIGTDGAGEQRVSEEARRPLRASGLRWRIPLADVEERRLAREVEAFLPGDEDWSAGPFPGVLPVLHTARLDKFTIDDGAVFRSFLESHAANVFDDRSEWSLRDRRVPSSLGPRFLMEDSTADFALQGPGIDMWILSPTHLPNGQVVFEMDERIYLIDPRTGDIAELAQGRSPLVLLREEDLASFEGKLPATDDATVLFPGSPAAVAIFRTPSAPREPEHP